VVTVTVDPADQWPPTSLSHRTPSEAINYEVAREVYSRLIALCSAAVAAEETKPEPDQRRIAEFVAQSAAWIAARRQLDPDDTEAITAVLRDLAPLARRAYDQS